MNERTIAPSDPGMIRPTAGALESVLAQHDDPVNVIWHDDECVESDVREVGWNRPPTVPDDPPMVSEMNDAARDIG